MIGIDECIEPNSYVLTISIDTHAAVINVNLNDKENEIFKNVRYYSQAGEYYYSISNTNNGVFLGVKSILLFYNIHRIFYA